MIGGLAHGRGQGAGRLVEGDRRILEQIVKFERGESCIPRQHEVQDQGILLTAARRFARRRDRHKTRQIGRFLSVRSVNGEEV
jgi:hypothetical protein